MTQTLQYDPIVYSLETPKYHLVQLDAINRFSGWVFYFGDKKIDSLNVYQDEQFLDHFEVNLPREDMAGYVPSIPAAKTCGFAFDIKVSANSNKLIFEIVFEDASKELFFEFEVAKVFEQQAYLSQLSTEAQNFRYFKSPLTPLYERGGLNETISLFVLQYLRTSLDSISMPTGELVFLTQGHDNVEIYKGSIIPAVLNMRQYLEHCGVNINQIQSLLDFGCGSGRLLVGWHLIAPVMELHGCDFNNHLLFWAQSNLPPQIKCSKNYLIPPLPYSDNQFDLIYLISVFTHLSLDTQQMWIRELKRILKVGGYILLTLHGEIYLHNIFWQEQEKKEIFFKEGFVTKGFLFEEGSNNYGTCHTPEFIEKLFEGFRLVGYFPNGRINQHRMLFQIAQSQDIYVFQYV